MATEDPTPREVGFGVSSRLLLVFAVLLAILLVAIGASTAQVTQPEGILCPRVPGYEVSSEGTPRSHSRGEWGFQCGYSSTNVDADGFELESSLLLSVIWLSELTQEDIEAEVTHPAGVAISRCSDEEFFGDGYGVLASGDSAVSVTYEFGQPNLPYSVDGGRAAAETLRASVAAFAISCEGVEIIPRSSYFTPLPAYLADALADIESTGPPVPVGAAPADPPATTDGPGATPATTAPAAVAPASPGDGPTTGAGPGSDAAKLLGFVLIGLALAGLLWALAMARREHRVRPAFDVIRVVLIGGAAVGSLVLLGETPAWAVAAGVGSGATLGWIQGRNVTVRKAGKRAYEKRNVLAVLAFGLGLAVSQGAGLLNRTGVIGIGVGLTFLSAATLAGLIAGRRKPLGAVRATAMVWIAVVGVVALALLSTRAGATAQEPTSEEERRAAVIAQLTDAVPWDSIEITGGLFTNAGKPFATISVPPGLTAPPDPLTRTIEWTRTFSGGGEVMYQLTETFTFALNADGACCTVAYEGEGSTTRDDGEMSVTKAAGVLGDFVGVGGRRDPAFRTTFDDKWGLPFQETVMLQPGTDEPFCRRPVAQPPGFSSNGAWEVYETDGVAVDGGEPLFGMYTQCDIPGFDAATAQSLLPPVPAATAPEREVRDFGTSTGGCPVFQEAFNALHARSAGSAPTEYLQRLIMRPNSAACSAWVFVGEEGRGGVRSEMQYDLATDNDQVEATRLYDAVEDMYTSLPAHEIPADETCDIGGDGIARAPLNEDEPCRLRTFHKFGEGEITIWTDYDTSDGPNVIIRGAFPWGHYFYTCHHCDPSSPEVPRIIAAMHRFGTTGIGNFGPNAQVIGSVGAPEGRVGETRDVFDGNQDLVDLFAEDPNDPIERAAIAAALGLIASGAMVGLGLAENRLDRKDGAAQDVATDAPGEGDDDEVSVWDEENRTAIWMTQAEADVWYADQRVKDRRKFEKAAARESADAAEKRSEKTWKEQQAAAERIRNRLEEEAKWAEWEKRMKTRDAMEKRQDLLEADSIRKSSAPDWWSRVLDEYTRGVWDDYSKLPGELYDAFGNGIRKVHEELSDLENWRILGETIGYSAVDALRIAVGDPKTILKVGGNLKTGIETAAEVAGTLYAAAENDPSGAAAGLLKVLLGAENWEKALDKDTPLSERLARVAWGIFETGGALYGAGATGLKVLDKMQDMARGAGSVSDASTAARAIDKTTDALRAADKTTDALRAADKTTDTARAADKAADKAADGKRIADPEALADLRAKAKARREAEAAVVPFDELMVDGKLPPDAWIRNLPSGAEIPRSWLHEAGYTQKQIEALADVAKTHNVKIVSRTTNMDSMRWIRDGKALHKPLDIKSKTINRLDTYLGASKGDEGLVGYFRPKKPDLSKVPDDLHGLVNERYKERLEEFLDLRKDVNRLITEGKAVEKNGKLYAVVGDKHIPYAGDIDLVMLRNADGSELSPAKYREVIAALKKSGARVQHGAESDVISHFTKGLTKGTPEYKAAYAKGVKLQKKLEDAHLLRKEVNMEMGTDGVLRRGERLDSLPIMGRS